MHDFTYLKDVVTLELNQEKCNGCGMCLKVCPHDVFHLKGGKAHIINHDQCMECGACSLNCPMEAIYVRSGVGCAAGILSGILNNSEPNCGCSGNSSTCC
jgi:NAD-dependent dihydropyrimidine dehydrogenase PreA subunit